MTENTLHGLLDEIARLATDGKDDRAAMREITNQANRGMKMLGNPDEAMAAKAAHLQKLVADGVDPTEAVKLAGLSPGE